VGLEARGGQQSQQNPWLTEAEAIAEWWATNANTPGGADLEEQYKDTIIAGAKSIACHSFFDSLPNKIIRIDLLDEMCMTLMLAVAVEGGPVTVWAARLAGEQVCHWVISQTFGQLEAVKDMKDLMDAICDNIAPSPDPLNVCMYCKSKSATTENSAITSVTGNLLTDPNNCGFCGNRVRLPLDEIPYLYVCFG
jgi:hypothetical protein